MPAQPHHNKYNDTSDPSLARIGHELRTPLTPALLAISSLLENPTTPDDLRPDLAVALEGITQEACLIQQLLDAMQIQRAQLWERTMEGGHRANGGHPIDLSLESEVTRRINQSHRATRKLRNDPNGSGATSLLWASEKLTPQSTPPLLATRAEPFRSLRILLVEDNPIILRFLRAILIDKGHEVFAAPDLAEARQFAGTRQFDLLLSDIELPDGTGLELVRELAPRRILAVAISAFGSPEDVRLSLEAGFFEHLTKPINVHQLGQALEQATEKIAATTLLLNHNALVSNMDLTAY